MAITSISYIHPEDRAALENLKAIPLFSACVRAFMKLGIERFVHGQCMAQKIRLGPEQLPEIYRYLPLACTLLDIDEPEFYLEMDPQPNAYTLGDTRVFITVTSGLIEMLEEDEVQAVVAHECGHVACQHVLYHTMAQMLMQFGSLIFGPLAAVSLPVQLALFYWFRRSEFSSDRAAAVVMNGSQSVVETMIRLAGGSQAITANVNLDLYLQQAESFDRLLESKWDKTLQGMAAMHQTHPFLAVRAREITRWCSSEQFQRILEEHRAAQGPRCARCHRPVRTEWKFCKQCGQPTATPQRPEDFAQ